MKKRIGIVDTEPTWVGLCNAAQSGAIEPKELLQACKTADVVRQAQKDGKKSVTFEFTKNDKNIKIFEETYPPSETEQILNNMRRGYTIRRGAGIPEKEDIFWLKEFGEESFKILKKTPEQIFQFLKKEYERGMKND